MFTQSIRWRMQLWLAFLLTCILTGFGVTAYQLQRINQLNQIDEDLARRLFALDNDIRGHPPLGPPRGPWPGGLSFRANSNFSRFDPPPEGMPQFPGLDELRLRQPASEPKARRSGRGGFGEGPEGRRFPGERMSSAGPTNSVAPAPDLGREGRGPKGPGLENRPPRSGFDRFLDAREIQLSSATLSMFEETDFRGYYYAIWSREGNLLTQSSNAPLHLASPPEKEDNYNRIHTQTHGVFREAYSFTEIGECILAGRSMAADLAAIRRFGWLLATVGGGVLALGLAGGWLVAGRALRPVEEISATASRISAGNLSERINVSETENELGRLAAVLNSTFARLDAAFSQQRQFTADASHELRTPLAVLISEAQTTLARQRTAAEYRETVEACLDTAQQMRRLTQSLLELARYDAGQETIQRLPLDLADRARACVDLVEPLARQRGLRLVADLSPAFTRGDADRLDQVVTNLVSNAVSYNRDGGEIRVATRVENGEAVLVVSDTGQGIAKEDLGRVFERFYRADKARGRASGHSGLGLAICKAIVEAHGGGIGLASQVGVGTTFTVRLPGHSETSTEKPPGVAGSDRHTHSQAADQA